MDEGNVKYRIQLTQMRVKCITNTFFIFCTDFQEGRYEDCITMSNKCLRALDMYTDDEIQNKKEIQGKIYSFIGSSFLELNFLKEALDNHELDLKIAKEM